MEPTGKRESWLLIQHLNPTLLYNVRLPAGRLTYLAGSALIVVMRLALATILPVETAVAARMPPSLSVLDCARVPLFMVLLIGEIAIHVRRLKDLGLPGLLVIFALVPVANILLFCLCAFARGKSTSDPDWLAVLPESPRAWCVEHLDPTALYDASRPAGRRTLAWGLIYPIALVAMAYPAVRSAADGVSGIIEVVAATRSIVTAGPTGVSFDTVLTDSVAAPTPASQFAALQARSTAWFLMGWLAIPVVQAIGALVVLVHVRRLRAMGKPAWWAALSLLPLLNLWLLYRCLAAEGRPHAKGSEDPPVPSHQIST